MNPYGSTKRLFLNLLGLAAVSAALVAILLWVLRPNSTAVNEPPSEPATESQASTEPAPGSVPGARAEPVRARPADAPAPTLEQQWGLLFSSVGLRVSNTVVELQYQVMDLDKTTVLAQRAAETYLIDQVTGTKLQMLAPQVEPGALKPVRTRSLSRMMRDAGAFPPPASKLAVGQTYSLLVPNWGGTLKSGSKVTVVVGTARQEGLVVQ